MLSLLLTACKKVEPVNLFFSVEDDKNLGLQLRSEIESNPDEYPVLDREEYPDAYAYIENLRDQVLESDAIIYRDEFDWEIRIIDDEVLNAFAAPGGYIYFYTGLIKFLEEEDDLMGVMGHEIAHADQRHSVKQMTKTYGVQLLLSAALGENPSMVEQVLAGIASQGASLKFSRSDETEADAYSVEYLSTTPYRCDGAAVFFQRLSDESSGVEVPAFLSTHPNPETRVEDITSRAEELECSTTAFAPDSYDAFKAMLP
ncbi:MAG: M48 family metalloprotease [Salibacteraceae bacterium]